MLPSAIAYMIRQKQSCRNQAVQIVTSGVNCSTEWMEWVYPIKGKSRAQCSYAVWHREDREEAQCSEELLLNPVCSRSRRGRAGLEHQ